MQDHAGHRNRLRQSPLGAGLGYGRARDSRHGAYGTATATATTSTARLLAFALYGSMHCFVWETGDKTQDQRKNAWCATGRATASE